MIGLYSNKSESWPILCKPGMCEHLDNQIKNCVNCRARPTRGSGNYRNHILWKKHFYFIFIILSGECQGPLASFL